MVNFLYSRQVAVSAHMQSHACSKIKVKNTWAVTTCKTTWLEDCAVCTKGTKYCKYCIFTTLYVLVVNAHASSSNQAGIAYKFLQVVQGAHSQIMLP